jgi:hypothetical protein
LEQGVTLPDGPEHASLLGVTALMLCISA